MSAILFIVVLLLLVLVHEFGHFIVAKKAGIRVDEFAFGFPPKLWSWKNGETTYAVNALPLGGYVKIYGEDLKDIAEGQDAKRSFVAQSRTIQALVIIAGIVFNLLFAWLLFALAFMIGVPASLDAGDGYSVSNPQLIITEVADKSPAMEAGLQSGDVLKTLSDDVGTADATNPDQIIAFIAPREGRLISLVYERKGRIEHATMIPVSGIVPRAAAIGIYMDTVGTLRLPPHIALWVGLKKTYQFTAMITVGIVKFLGSAITGHANLSQVTGPIGIARSVGDAAGVGFSNLIFFTALISINLAIINLIPFPALDGGRLLFIAVEGIIRRPIKRGVANAFNIAGFAFLMLLMVAVTYHDILRLMH